MQNIEMVWCRCIIYLNIAIILYKTSGSLWKYYRDDPNDNIIESESFIFKTNITGNTPDNDNIKNVEIEVPLKYLSNFWRTLEIPLINCEINHILTWLFLLQLEQQNLK